MIIDSIKRFVEILVKYLRIPDDEFDFDSDLENDFDFDFNLGDSES